MHGGKIALVLPIQVTYVATQRNQLYKYMFQQTLCILIFPEHNIRQRLQSLVTASKRNEDYIIIVNTYYHSLMLRLPPIYAILYIEKFSYFPVALKFAIILCSSYLAILENLFAMWTILKNLCLKSFPIFSMYQRTLLYGG